MILDAVYVVRCSISNVRGRSACQRLLLICLNYFRLKFCCWCCEERYEMGSPLGAALGIDREGLVKRFLSVNEFHGSNANFVIASLMVDSFKRGHGICLISLHNTLGHYHHVLTKMSAINLTELREKSAQLEAIELISDLREHMYCEVKCPHDLWDKHDQISMHQLFCGIRDKVRKLLETHSNVSVIIDDASHFLDMGVPLRDVLSLLQYCRTLLTMFSGVSLVVLTHVIPDGDSNLLAINVAHVADTVVNISVLKTGHSSDVSGVMEVKDKANSDASYEQWNTSSLFHFKVMDRQIKLYAPGTSMLRT